MRIIAFDATGGYRGFAASSSPVIFALSTFGRVRNGFNRLNY